MLFLVKDSAVVSVLWRVASTQTHLRRRNNMVGFIPNDFELVVGAVVVSTFVHHVYMALQVGKARKKCVLSLYPRDAARSSS